MFINQEQHLHQNEKFHKKLNTQPKTVAYYDKSVFSFNENKFETPNHVTIDLMG